MFDNFFNKLLKWLIFISLYFPSPSVPLGTFHKNIPIGTFFLFGENRVESRGSISPLRTRGMKFQLFISSDLREDPPKQRFSCRCRPGESWRGGPQNSPVGESPGCALEFFRNWVLVFIGSGISSSRASNATFTRVS